jgi:hypothetical protein
MGTPNSGKTFEQFAEAFYQADPFFISDERSSDEKLFTVELNIWQYFCKSLGHFSLSMHLTPSRG